LVKTKNINLAKTTSDKDRKKMVMIHEDGNMTIFILIKEEWRINVLCLPKANRIRTMHIVHSPNYFTIKVKENEMSIEHASFFTF
jgi:hypothetical protein